MQQQLATGKSLNQPSDNPAAVTQVLALSGQASQLTSWQSNADTASSWLGTANQTANSVLESMQSAQSLLLQSLNQGAQDPTTYEALGDQLQGVVSNLLSLSNTQYEGRPIFAGTSASPQAYDTSGNYLGNGDVPTVVIGPGSGAGQTVGLSVPGTTIFGVGAANVFATLTAAVTALSSGAPTSANLSAALTALNANISTAQQASAVLGDSSQEVASTSSALTTQIASVQSDQADLRRREHRHGHDAARLGDDQLSGGTVGGVAGHPRDPGEVRRSVRLQPVTTTMPTLEGDRSMLTTAPPITVTGMELTFRRDMPGFKAARHFVVEPLGGEADRDFRASALYRHGVRAGEPAHRQPHPVGHLTRVPLARL